MILQLLKLNLILLQCNLAKCNVTRTSSAQGKLLAELRLLFQSLVVSTDSFSDCRLMEKSSIVISRKIFSLTLTWFPFCFVGITCKITHLSYFFFFFLPVIVITNTALPGQRTGEKKLGNHGVLSHYVKGSPSSRYSTVWCNISSLPYNNNSWT